MVNHGLSTGALFLLVGMIYERRHTREIAELKGLQKAAPILAGVFTVVMLSSIGLPGLNGFVGEFLILHRLVPHPAVVGGGRRGRRDPRRALPAVGVPAGVPRRRPTRRTPTVARPQLARGAGDGAAPRPASCSSASTRSRCSTAWSRPSTGSSSTSRTTPTSRQPVEPARTRRPRCRGRGGRADDPRCSPPSTSPSRSTPHRSPSPRSTGSAIAARARADRRRAAPHGRRRLRRGAAAARQLALCIDGGHRGCAIVAAALAVGPGPRRRPRAVHRRWRARSASTASRVFLTVLICCGGRARRAARRRLPPPGGSRGPELYVLMLLSASGGVIMASANDLIVMFLGLEILSIAVYVLAALHLRRLESQEAGIKYFVLGRLLVGLPPLRHRARLRRHRVHQPRPHPRRSSRRPSSPRTASLLAGFALLLVGFGFKVAAVPFHFWTPDVYQGSPTPVVGVHGLGRQGGRASPGCSASSYLAFDHLPDRLAADRLRPGRADAAGRLGARRRADRREAHARLLVDQPRRLHAGRRAGRVRATASHRRSSTSPPTRSWSPAASASSPSSAAAGDAAHRLDDYRGLSQTRPGAGADLRRVPARPGGRAAHLGLLRQVLRDRGRGRRHSVRLGRHRHGLRGHRRLPVPADHRRHVHRRRRTPTAPKLHVPFSAGIALGVAALFTLVVGVWPGPVSDWASQAIPVLGDASRR